MNDTKQNVSADEFIELNSIPAAYSNRCYLMLNGPMVKMVHCERSQNVDDTKARAAICMTIADFFAFSDLIKANREEIDKQIKAMGQDRAQ